MRKIYLVGEVNNDMFLRMAKHMDQLESESAHKPIYIELFSPGGSAPAGLAIYGKIRACQAPVYIKAFGECHSAATLILVAGDKRSASAEISLMVHDSTLKLKGTVNELHKQVKELLFDEMQWTQLIASRSRLTLKEWRKMHRQTTYFTAQQALEFGLIDEIIKVK